MSKRRNLKRTKVFISEDLPKQELEAKSYTSALIGSQYLFRKKLITEMKHLRETGQWAYIDYDKIIITKIRKLRTKTKNKPCHQMKKTTPSPRKKKES